MAKQQSGIDRDFLMQHLGLVQQFFPRIDGKATFLFGIVSAQIAFTAATVTPSDFEQWWVVVPLVIFGLLALTIIWQLYRCAYPNLEGGHGSLIYFAEIAKRREADFCAEILNADEKTIRDDLAGQIWRNSQIASEKFQHLKIATVAAMVGLLPWGAYLVGSSLVSAGFASAQ